MSEKIGKKVRQQFRRNQKEMTKKFELEMTELIQSLNFRNRFRLAMNLLFFRKLKV